MGWTGASGVLSLGLEFKWKSAGGGVGQPREEGEGRPLQ